MIALLTKHFGPLGAKLIFFGGLALLIGITLLLAYCQGRDDGRSGETIKQQQREIEVQRDVGKANENAAANRVDSATNAAREKQELDNALKASPDPIDQRVRRGCAIMRQQGRDVSSIPACRRP